MGCGADQNSAGFESFGIHHLSEVISERDHDEAAFFAGRDETGVDVERREGGANFLSIRLGEKVTDFGNRVGQGGKILGSESRLGLANEEDRVVPGRSVEFALQARNFV